MSTVNWAGWYSPQNYGGTTAQGTITGSPLSASQMDSNFKTLGAGVDALGVSIGAMATFPSSGIAGIISTGSNANGYWTKFADGTMFQRGSMTGSAGTYAYASMYETPMTITFPLPFIGPIPNVSPVGFTDSDGCIGACLSGVPTLTTSNIVLFRLLNSITTWNLQWTAWGRWQ